MEIRPAREADIPVLLSLFDELMEPPGGRAPGYSPEVGSSGIRYALESPLAEVLVAEEDGAVIGLATLYETFVSVRHGKRCWLQDLVVTRERRSRRAGKALLEAATEWARKRGCTHLMLDSGNARKDSHRFYLREGMLQPSITFERLLD